MRQPLSVLMVEDEHIIALAEKKHLEAAGYAVIHAASGEAAVEAVRSGASFDIVLMDINLGPGMDGTQAAEAILRLRDLPILFLSSHTERAIVEKTEGISGYGYVVKNSSITVLDASMKMALKLHGANRRAAEELENRRKAEEAVREALAFNRLIIESANEGIIVYGPDLRYRVWNPYMERMTGVKAAEVLGRHPLEVFPFLQDVGQLARVERALAGETPEPAEFPVYINGRSGWNIDTSSPMRGADGSVIGVIATVQDVTETRKLLEEKARSEARYRGYIELTSEGFFVADRDGNILDVNEAGCAITGYTKAELLKKNSLDMKHPGTERLLPRILSEGSARTQGRFIRKDGVTRWCDISGLLLPDGTILVDVHDVTECREAAARRGAAGCGAPAGAGTSEADGAHRAAD